MEASINKGRASVNIPWWSVGLHEHLTSLEGFFFCGLNFFMLMHWCSNFCSLPGVKNRQQIVS